MQSLSPNTVLRCVPSINMRLDPGGAVRISREGRELWFGTHCLAVLDVFSSPREFGEALKRLEGRVRSAQDWLDLTSTILQLHQAGILEEEGRTLPFLSSDPYGFDAAAIHVEMLNDEARTSGFLAAIRETVRPGDVVVDLGTGTGVLAVAAARAGASHVYAIEAGSIGKAAKAVFEANGLADRITLLEGWSTRVNLPEKADVLVSEVIGNEPLGESVLETVLDAHKRHLKPDARLVPRKVLVYGLPLVIPRAELNRRTFSLDVVESWRHAYGIDFSPLARLPGSQAQSFHVRPSPARGWKRISDPILLFELDLGGFGDTATTRFATGRAIDSGVLNGLMVFFELELSPGKRLSTDPAIALGTCHWRNLVEVVPNPFPVREGDELTVTYRYRAAGPPVEVKVSRS